MGIDHMYLFFDDPNDQSIPCLEKNNRLSLFRCDDAHWSRLGLTSGSKIQLKQEQNSTLSFHMARESGFEWMIHLDHDELMYGPYSIKHFFNSVSKKIDIVRFPVMEAMPQKRSYENPYLEISDFKVYNALSATTQGFTTNPKNIARQEKAASLWHLKKRIARVLRSAHITYDIGNNFLHGHQVGKSASRTSANISVIKNHIPAPAENSKPELKVSQSFYVLHYDCMGFDSWKHKWKSRITGDANFPVLCAT
jgi:hypothetical protein